MMDSENNLRLVIDIGTNSVLALLADVSGGGLKIIFDEKKTTRLGRGLSDSGCLSAESMNKTADAITSFMARGGFDSVLLLGTEALRSASNADEFRDLISDRTGKRIIVVSGSKEAELNYLGALYGLNISDDSICILDVGGGSSELAVGVINSMTDAVSMPIGASRLFETGEEDKLDYYIRKATDDIRVRIERLGIFEERSTIATGGTITSLAAMETGLEKYDPHAIHGVRLSVKQIKRISSKFEGLDTKERTDLIPFDPERADLILPGAGIILAVLGIIKKDTVIVSTGGLRFGAVLYPERVSI